MTADTTLRATTSDGRSAVLYKDGTWKFVETAPGATADSSEAGFRKSSWGMSLSEVESAEGRDDIEHGDNFLRYEGRIGDMPCEIYFVFAYDQLVRGRIFFTVEHTNTTDFIHDFESVKQLLIKKYGAPQRDEEIWKDDLYKDEPSEWGTAVESGRLVKYSTWNVGETAITLTLSGDNFEITFTIDYVSTRLGHLESNLKESQALDEL